MDFSVTTSTCSSMYLSSTLSTEKGDESARSFVFKRSLPKKRSFSRKDISKEHRIKVIRGWKQKYDFLLGVVKEPSRLLPESLTQEVRSLDSKHQTLVIERAMVQSKLEFRGDSKGATKGRKIRERPENIRALYEQVVNLDCLLTSIETQIEVLSSVQDSLPKEFQDTFHDSGTSGHEPDSLDAIETLVGNSKGMLDKRNNTDGTIDQGPGPGGGKLGEAAVLLHLERCAHRQTRRSLQEMEIKLKGLHEELAEKNVKLAPRSVDGDDVECFRDINLNSLLSLSSIASSDRLVEELKVNGVTNFDYPQIKILFPSPYLAQLREMTVSQLRLRVLQLEKARLDKVPMDAAKEISRLNATLIHLEKARDELTLQNFTLKSRLAEVTSKINDPAATYQISKESSLNLIHIDDISLKKNLKSTYKVNSDSQKLRQMYSEFGATEEEYKRKIGQLEESLKNQQNDATQNFDRHIRNLESQFENSQKSLEVTQRFLLEREEECNMVKLDVDTLNEENKRLKEQLNDSIRKYQDIDALNQQYQDIENDLRILEDENRVLVEDFNRERVLRKKYYNQIEEMKGKIRVFCRVRPFNDTERRTAEVTKIEDEFSLSLDTSRGLKSFQFDRVFTPDEDQEQVFRDTRALIQSALDGYNVTIMAYGQTGSGKTYTLLGTDSCPGVAPRAFLRIFQLAEEGRARHTVSVSAFMLELYNDKLIDLFKSNGYNESSEKLDIKRDKKGSVFVAGACVRKVSSATELIQAFEEGLSIRHTASTKMNLSSSRSHLLITVLLTVTSKQTGAVFKGKLTLVDLAGSERVHKSGVTADQLREANSINKSLSALGDVIAALSTESSFVPYRNSKLTMLLQDSIGGNAKTLVFVNVSPAAFNCEETLVSLMYASRIKLITNNAFKNSETKEICRLKAIISKLKKGEEPDEEFL